MFVVGSDDAQVLFYPDFDQIVLLRAPRDVDGRASRVPLQTIRSARVPTELARILADLETFEPSMRRAATYEIDTSKPLDRVVDEILQLGPAAAANLKEL